MSLLRRKKVYLHILFHLDFFAIAVQALHQTVVNLSLLRPKPHNPVRQQMNNCSNNKSQQTTILTTTAIKVAAITINEKQQRQHGRQQNEVNQIVLLPLNQIAPELENRNELTTSSLNVKFTKM